MSIEPLDSAFDSLALSSPDPGSDSKLLSDAEYAVSSSTSIALAIPDPLDSTLVSLLSGITDVDLGVLFFLSTGVMLEFESV